ncbi:outer membrane protein (porin)-like protein [Caballeronia glebae]|uniref:Outer membrane protein (Porin)-like protein n=1 Tax=Caballeronia glebae TaxID=1777143 RepID=A0A158A3U0_9BURK|nr:porin [Caballeronia glebae]SAK52369.1 outer membrane protein (porin)-like protein [Caballeronia glebae]
MGLCLVGTSAMAQQVTLYGTIDTGITYISNAGGKSLIEMQPNIMWKSAWGIKGTEDIGSGTKVFFDISNTFNTATGANYGFGPAFGVTNDTWGTLTAGQLNDFMFLSLTVSRWGPQLYSAPPYYTSAGPFDKLGLNAGTMDFNGLAGWYVFNNALSYRSPTINGLTVGAMYAFGNVAGHMGRGDTQSFGVDFSRGPLQMDAAYTFTRSSDVIQSGQALRNWGLGGRMAVGAAFIDAIYTNTRNTAVGTGVQVIGAGAQYPVTRNTVMSMNYHYDWANAAQNSYHAHQIGAGLFYGLSKRTDVYLNLVWQRASGDGAVAEVNYTHTASSTASQTVARVGMTHRF